MHKILYIENNQYVWKSVDSRQAENKINRGANQGGHKLDNFICGELPREKVCIKDCYHLIQKLFDWSFPPLGLLAALWGISDK